MSLIARFPRSAAWIVCCALIGVATLWAVLGLTYATPAAPSSARRAHGIVIVVRPTGAFCLRVAGRAGALCFQPAAGAAISLAHLRRHLRERAGTDVVYQIAWPGVLLAWSAD